MDVAIRIQVLAVAEVGKLFTKLKVLLPVVMVKGPTPGSPLSVVKSCMNWTLPAALEKSCENFQR